MNSLKKNFSIAQLYSDLEKYESNLSGIKDSRLKKQSSGSSLHQRPSSTHHRNQHDSRDSLGGLTNLARFEKSKLEVKPKSKYGRPTFEKSRHEDKGSSFLFANGGEDQHVSGYGEYTNSHNNSVLRENPFADRQEKENRKSHEPKLLFNKSDELYFLSECNKLYGLPAGTKPNKANTNSLTAEEEADSVRVLLNQINKRDRVYEVVTRKLGNERVEQKLEQFLQSYERMQRIIEEFKRMSKLDIENQQELYEFLCSQEEGGEVKKGNQMEEEAKQRYEQRYGQHETEAEKN